MSKSGQVHYRGITRCCTCHRKAYYQVLGEPLCGLHATKETRKKLPEVPVSIRNKNQEEYFQAARASPASHLGLAKQLMMKEVRPGQPGYLVFPNFRAKPAPSTSPRSKVEFAMPELSPMRLGPVEHQNPAIPIPATNIENYHQFSKVFPSELDGQGNPTPEFYTRRLEGFADPVPHRHKFSKDKAEHMRIAGIPAKGNANHCALAVHYHPGDGAERHLSYVEARKFYCSFYEDLARQQPQYDKIKELLSRGTVYICGYDAIDLAPLPVGTCPAKLVGEWYQDEGKPFGHEKVLFAMLACDASKVTPPWRQ
jgi:hypothetical protein